VQVAVQEGRVVVDVHDLGLGEGDRLSRGRRWCDWCLGDRLCRKGLLSFGLPERLRTTPFGRLDDRRWFRFRLWFRLGLGFRLWSWFRLWFRLGLGFRLWSWFRLWFRLGFRLGFWFWLWFRLGFWFWLGFWLGLRLRRFQGRRR
jgi:hypothetical protein